MSATPPPADATFDALLPASMARKAEEAGAAKLAIPAIRVFTLSVLAGAFIAFGAMFSSIVATGTGDAPYGFVRLAAGLVFSLGLVLVVVGGAELFTGNNLLVMAWVGRRATAASVARNWGIVFAGNFVGALAIAALAFAGALYDNGSGAVGREALDIAAAKTSLSFGVAFVRGILANVLVCLAVWMCFSARTVTDKVVAIILPISAFVAAGFEHSVANMYLIPFGLLVKASAPDSFWEQAGTRAGAYPDLTWRSFTFDNLVPVTLGNIVGGAVLVGLVYAFIYARRPASD